MENDNQETLKLKVLYEISEIAAQAKDLPSLWTPLLNKVLQVLKVDAGTLMTIEGDFLVRQVAQGLEREIMEEPPIPSAKDGISWKAVETRKPQVILDLSKEKIASEKLAEAGFHSLVTVPMMVREQVIGVMSIFSRKECHFSEDDLNFFIIIANQAALAIISLRSAEILGENRQRLSELEALNQISKSVATLFDFEETLFSIIASITKMLRGDKGVFALFDHQDHLLKAQSPSFGLSPSQIRDFRTRNDEGITGQAFCKGVPIMMAELDEETKRTLARAKITGVKSMLAAPLKVKSQTLGVIQVFSENPHNFKREDLRLLTILSAQAAIVVNSSSMYREIAEERKRAEALLSSIGEGVLAIDKEQKIIHLNKAGEKITGYLAEELLGKNFLATLGLWTQEKKPVEAENSPVSQVLKEGKPVVIKDFYLKRRSGKLFPAYLTFSAIYDADNKIIGAIVIFRDITYEFELAQMKQELVSIATHELRAPIAAIKGYLDMILKGDMGEVKGEIRDTLEEIVKINQQLADLVDDLLNVGRIEQGSMSIKLQTTDLNHIIDQTLQEYLLQAEDKKLHLSADKKTMAKVKADPARVRQVLSNFISNALKYTEKGSIQIITEEKGQEVICQVKDTGIGISPANQKKLFEKYSRIKNDQTRQITGTGLGLWICQRLVEMMAGKVWLESEEGKGSSFYFSLPRAT